MEDSGKNDRLSTINPPFPSDVPTAPLLRLSLEKLLNNDTEESTRFYQACKNLGFFYLDLRGTSIGESILKDADRLFDVGEKLFELDLEEKEKYDFSAQHSYYGYKGYGKAVIDRTGTLDRNEFYNVSKDDVICLCPPLPAPELLGRTQVLQSSYIHAAHSIVSILLTHLDTHLHLQPPTLPSLHRLTSSSGDQIRFIKAPPQPRDDRRTTLGEHTDYGSITILFNRLGGLQVLPPGEDAQWCYVRPLPGHAIVNLGDAMVKFTNGLLRSNIHRVVSPPGAQAECTRYSLVYFSRPEDDVVLKRLEGSNVIPELGEGEVDEEVSSKDWIIRRAMTKRTMVYKQGDWDKATGTERPSAKSRM